MPTENLSEKDILDWIGFYHGRYEMSVMQWDIEGMDYYHDRLKWHVEAYRQVKIAQPPEVALAVQ